MKNFNLSSIVTIIGYIHKTCSHFDSLFVSEFSQKEFLRSLSFFQSVWLCICFFVVISFLSPFTIIGHVHKTWPYFDSLFDSEFSQKFFLRSLSFFQSVWLCISFFAVILCLNPFKLHVSLIFYNKLVFL